MAIHLNNDRLNWVARWSVILGIGAMLATAHLWWIDLPAMPKKLAHHAGTLANTEPDPYQYKFWAISWLIEGVHRATGIGLSHLYIANTCLGIVALVLAHERWLRHLCGPRAALVGTFVLAAYCHSMFRRYHHHPYDFWGVALFCCLLTAMVMDRKLWKVTSISLVTGVFWEKHVLAAILGGARKWRGGVPFLKAAGWAIVVGASAVAVPVAVRLICGGDRGVADITPLANQAWKRVLGEAAPFLGIPAVAAIASWRRLPEFVRWLWWYVPVMYVAYAVDKHFLYELRSFWAFVPVFTATVATWACSPEGNQGETLCETRSALPTQPEA